ncbi:MFS transporter [Leptolyngbya sp. FACHB-541]|uniref:MFS transporter n=1 Tax=Leptolyngbya sp. FACHB-541 TaxID=2692810 RepID=UPI0016854526|nr:MFS transporter [Leptolyngbya sp. FACHB-541]MBD2000536.1 MFS transporter [Leptolyngbya sp. FACHB-541]
MKLPFYPVKTLLDWLPDLKREVWLLAAGQLLLFIGHGFTLVYTSIYFVNTLGFSPTQVGLALGSGGISGTLGRFWAGNAIDSERLGRRGTLLIAAVIAALGSFSLAFASTFPLLVVGNLLLGLGISLYWPATLSITTDLTPVEHRTEAIALTRLADNLGLGLGALLAGQYLAMEGSYGALFICKGLAYLVFGGVVAWTITETRQPHTDSLNVLQSWGQALRDRRLLTYLAANVFFTTYAAQLSSTLPLYLANFVPWGNTETGFSEAFISYFFVWHALLKIVLQLPVTRWLRSVPYVPILFGSLVLWAAGFFLIWLVGLGTINPLILILLSFACIAIAEVLYAPSASALVGELAPVTLRGIYFALESQCWAIGYLVGPILGGWALDHPVWLGTNFWLALVLTSVISGLFLLLLRSQLTSSEPAQEATPSSSS